MRVEDLRNYGKSLAEWTDEESGRISKAYSQGIMKELGIFGSMKLMLKMRREAGRMKNHDWSMLKEWGWTNEKELKRFIEGVAGMKAMSDMLGMDQYVRMATRVVEREEMYAARASIVPAADDYKQCGDAVTAWRQYVKAMMAAEERTGVAKAVMVEENDAVLAFRVERCFLLEIGRAFGNPNVIYPMCHMDEVYYSRLAAQLGCKCSMTTKAGGAPECGVRIERIHAS